MVRPLAGIKRHADDGQTVATISDPIQWRSQGGGGGFGRILLFRPTDIADGHVTRVEFTFFCEGAHVLKNESNEWRIACSLRDDCSL